MAKELDKHKKEWAKLQKDIGDACEEIKQYEASLGQTTGVRDEGCSQLGLEIQRCKDSGMKGKTVEDFESDKEVKACLKSINEFQVQIEKEINRIGPLGTKTIPALNKRYWELSSALSDEVDKRDAKKNRKVASIDSKSLPEMKKLSDELSKYKDSRQFLKIGTFQADEIKQHNKELSYKLKDAVTQTKDVKLSKFQMTMMEGLLNERVLTKHLNQSMGIYKVILGHCKDARTAIDAGDAKTAKQSQDLATKEFRALGEKVKPFQQAVNDDWLKARLEESKAKGKIIKGVAGMSKMLDDSKEQLWKVVQEGKEISK